MKYKLADLMPKRYPENIPSRFSKRYWVVGNPMNNAKSEPEPLMWEFDEGQEWVWKTQVKWFIDIPGAPEELRPRKYPDEKPERAGRYVVHNSATDTWLTAYWNPLYEEWHNVSGNITGLYLAIDYFIPYPLEEEMEELDPYNKIKSIKIQYLDMATFFSGYGSNEEFIRNVADAYGYDITKRAPEIAPCPNPECDATNIHGEHPFIEEDDTHCFRVACNCGYRGPRHLTKEGAVHGHNQMVGKMLRDWTKAELEGIKNALDNAMWVDACGDLKTLAENIVYEINRVIERLGES